MVQAAPTRRADAYSSLDNTVTLSQGVASAEAEPRAVDSVKEATRAKAVEMSREDYYRYARQWAF